MSCGDLINGRLPDDLLAQVFRRVAAGGAAKRDLDRCALVCRRWLRASRRSARVPVGAARADDVVRGVAQRFPGLTEVTVDQDLSAADAIAAHAASSRRRGASNDESSSQHFARTVGMQEGHDYRVKASSLTDAGLVHLLEGCKQLEKLTLNWCFSIGLVGIANSCQNLRSLELLIGDKAIMSLSENCKELRELMLRSLERLTDTGLSAIGNAVLFRS